LQYKANDVPNPRDNQPALGEKTATWQSDTYHFSLYLQTRRYDFCPFSNAVHHVVYSESETELSRTHFATSETAANTMVIRNLN